MKHIEKIGFFGGCFNPPTITHIELVNNLIIDKKLDKVIFIPVSDFYQKEDLIKAKHRYNMLKLAVKNYKNLEIDNIELKINKKLYAVDIFELLKDKYKNKDIYYIMGTDNFKKMNTWKDYDIIKNYNYIILDRDKYKDVSSTKIRNLIKEDRDVSSLIFKEVYKYIIKHNLYSN